MVRGAASGGVIVGLNAGTAGWGGASTLGEIQRVVSGTGSRWLHEQFLWSQIEPRRGVFNFAYYDHYMLLASQAGERILPFLNGTPSWAGATSSTIPSNPAGFAAFVAAVVHRYGPHGSFWIEHRTLASYAITTFEIWNEPYYSTGDGGDYNPGAYARLVKAAGAAAHAADRDAKVLLAAESDTGVEQGDTWVDWDEAMYKAVPNLNHYFDGIAVHPYGPDTTHLTGDGDNQLRRVELIRSEFVAHGAADKPIWITEIGWPTCNHNPLFCTSATGQAQDIERLFRYVHTTWKSYVKAVFVYVYTDFGVSPSDPYLHFGLYTYAGKPKPALAVFRAIASTTAHTAPWPR